MWKSNYPINSTKVTVELGELVEGGIDIWDFAYDDYHKTPEEKAAFEQKFIDHYYFRQIGQETPARFLHCFRTRVKELLPYYTQLYKSTRFLDFDDDDIMKSYDLTETFSQQSTDNRQSSTESESSTSGTDSKTSNTDVSNTRKFSNTPQGSISNLDKYLTEGTVEDNSVDVTDSGSSSASGTASSSDSTTADGTVTHTLTRTGNIGVQPLGDELSKNRAAILNVDLQFIEEFNDLFLGVY